jgi:hypothetical protein
MAMIILRAGVFVAFVFSLVFLTAQVWGVLSAGRKRLHSEAAGSRLSGAAYALGRGMLPWEKESAAKHLPTYSAGIVYHAGIFAAIALALLLAAGGRLPATAVPVFRVALAAGFLAGAGLLIKRSVRPKMRHISCPDDFASNLLVDAFVLIGLWTTGRPSAAPVFLAAAVATFLYMPLGKIRHCFFFFYSRILFGSYFGRRGVLPPKRPAKA